MLTLSATALLSTYYKVRVGGDAAMLKVIMKALLILHQDVLAHGDKGVIDEAFIAEHTQGLAALKADLDNTAWQDIIAVSGLNHGEILHIASLYANAERTIICYGMGITQHQHGTQNVQQLANLLLRGNIGKPGEGICPLCVHSNVKDDRTVGITEMPSQALLDGIKRTFGFTPPAKHGHAAVTSVWAIQQGSSKALICLGSNLATVMPDPDVTFAAMRKLELVVHMATKLNCSHLLLAKTAIFCRCLAAPRRILRPTVVNLLPSRTQCLWSMRRAERCSRHPLICVPSRPSSRDWPTQRC